MDDGGVEQLTPLLPPELAADILSRLPVKPLLRFRCVSKPWCALIDSLNFTKLHLNHSIKTNQSLILSDAPHIPSEEYHGGATPSFLTRLVDLYPSLKNKGGIRVLGSCNGLCFVSCSLEELFLLNPCTKKHWGLAPNWIISNATPLRCSYNYFYGFGYVSRANDYKIVRIRQCYDDGWTRVLFTEVDVYSLGLDLWRRVECPLSPQIAFGSQLGMLVNECVHWTATKTPGVEVDNDLVAFDLREEMFRMVPLPGVERTGGRMWVRALGEHLVAVFKYERSGEDMWVMEEYGVTESWTKMISTEQSKGWDLGEHFVFWPITYSGDGDCGKIVLFECVSRSGLWFFTYDLKTKAVGKLNSRRTPCLAITFACLESLVTPDGWKKRTAEAQEEDG